MSAVALPTAASPRRWRWPVLIACGLCAVAAAGWLGWRQALDGGMAGATAASTPSGTATPPAGTPGIRDALSGVVTGDAAPVPRVAATPPEPAGSQPALAWPMWEFQLRQPIPPRDPPLTPPPWRLIGATLSADGWQVVIMRQGSTTPEYFGVGKELPGGYRIQAITDEDVTFVINKREVVLSYTGSR